MDRIESLFIQAVAVSTVAVALCAGLSIAAPAKADERARTMICEQA